MAARSKGEIRHLNRSQIGSDAFDVEIEKIILKNRTALLNSRTAILYEKVPDECIVYVVKNWDDSRGSWFYSMESAFDEISVIRRDDVISNFGSGKEGHQCLCIDGRKVRAMEKLLSEAIEWEPKRWEYHKTHFCRRKLA